MTKVLVYEMDLDLRELKFQLIHKVGWANLYTFGDYPFESHEELKNTDVKQMTVNQKKTIMKEYFKERLKVNDINKDLNVQYYPRAGKVYLRYKNPKDPDGRLDGNQKRTMDSIENIRDNADPEVIRAVIGPEVEEV